MKPLVYVAGPYTHPDPVENTRRAIATGLELYDTGKVGVLIPHMNLIAGMVEFHPLEYWYQYDLDQLAHCTAMYRLSGPSEGAEREQKFAQVRGIPVFQEHERAQLLGWADAWGYIHAAD